MSKIRLGGWIGVDLDGTLAHYDGWKGVEHIGAPIPEMLERVKAWVAAGETVKIFTARCFRRHQVKFADTEDEAYFILAEAKSAEEVIHKWLESHGLPRLELTCVKDFGMVELWDDRAVQVIPNTGQRADGN